MMAAGYADRLSVVAALALFAADELPLWLPLAYLAIAGAEVVLAVCKAGAGRELPRFVAATVAIFPLDALASLAAIAAHGLRRPRRWIHLSGDAVGGQCTAIGRSAKKVERSARHDKQMVRATRRRSPSTTIAS